MTVNFNLAHPEKSVSQIRLIVYHRGGMYRRLLPYKVKCSLWKRSRQQSGDRSIDDKLRAIRSCLEESLDFLSTPKQIDKMLENVLKGDLKPKKVIKTDAPTFWEYFEEWASRNTPGSRQKLSTMRLIQSLMGDSEDWMDIDTAYYTRLKQRLIDECYAKNYIAVIISRVKAVMSEGYKLKYHNNDDFRQFAKSMETTDAVYLTRKELNDLWELELDFKTPQWNARELFLVGCYTGARWEDFSTFSEDNFNGGQFEYYQRKTGNRVILPLSPRLKTIITRNGGKVPSMNQVVFNRTIKAVCIKAGITSRQVLRKTKGGKVEVTSVEKWKAISAHTARRTCITLLHQSGVPSQQLMLISGHRSLSSFEKYIKTTFEDNAKALSGLEFFK